MFPRPEKQTSWKLSRRKCLSSLRERSWLYIIQVFLLGLVAGFGFFGWNKSFSAPNHKDGVNPPAIIPVTNVTIPTATTPVPTTSSTPQPSATHAGPTPPSLLISGVPHPFPNEARAWLDIASNISGIQEPVITSSKPTLALFVLVKSAPAYLERRKLCRKNWQWRGKDGKTTIKGLLSQKFLVGASDSSKTDADVLKENDSFGDILIYPGNDTYRRLPWKVLWGLQYVSEQYEFDMLLLMDDDSFVNYPMVCARHMYTANVVLLIVHLVAASLLLAMT